MHSYGKIKQGLGYGKRSYVDYKHLKKNPGPGQYTLPTFCDKILKRYATLKGTMHQYTPGANRIRVRKRKRSKRRRGFKSARRYGAKGSRQ